MTTPIIVLDFESYYDQDLSLRKLPVPVYVNDPRFHLHGVAIRNAEGVISFETDVPAALADLQVKYGGNLERATIVVHNGHFDLYVLAMRFGIFPSYTIDTLQLSHALYGRKGEGGQSGKLADLATLMELPSKGDISWLSGERTLNGRQAMELSDYAKHDVELTYQIALRLLPQLSNPSIELPLAAHTLRLHHESRLRIDLVGVEALIEDIKGDASRFFEKAGVTPHQASSRTEFNQILEKALSRTGRKLPLKNGKNGQIPATAKTDEEMQALVDDDDGVVAALAQARLARGSEAQQVAKLQMLHRIGTATGGILPVHLVYHGAGTGRFAGGGRFNIQNLPKQGRASKIRSLIQAPPGHQLVKVDLAQIECRVTAWLAGEVSLLRAFVDGTDVYSREASAVFGREVRKPIKSDAPAEAELFDSLRQTGKQEVLGLGFQMGALKFMNTLRKDPKTAPLFDSDMLTAHKCRQIVDRFRGAFTYIVRLWGIADKAFRSVAQHGGSAWINSIFVQQVGDRVEVRLPSGRLLRYPRLRLERSPSTITYLNQQGEQCAFTQNGSHLVYGDNIRIYGGKIVENLAQAIARDILVGAVLRLTRRGVEIAAHVHDEIIALCRTEDADEVLRMVREEMERPPEWASGLTLAADGRYGPSLAKD